MDLHGNYTNFSFFYLYEIITIIFHFSFQFFSRQHKKCRETRKNVSQAVFLDVSRGFSTRFWVKMFHVKHYLVAYG